MRNNVEDARSDNVRHQTARFAGLQQTLAGTITLNDATPPVLTFDAAGATRIVVLPSLARERLFIIKNVGLTGVLDIRDSLGVSVATLSAEESAVFVAGRLNWFTVKTALNAASLSFTPVGGISATNVQAALAELDTEKAAIASLANIAFSGAIADIIGYETSTFTPTLTFGGAATGMTFSVQLGRYTRLGNLLVAWISFTLTNKGSSVGNVVIGGLPYASPNINGVASFRVQNMAAGIVTPLQGALAPGAGATSFAVEKVAAGVATSLTDADFNNNTSLRCNVVYQT